MRRQQHTDLPLPAGPENRVEKEIDAPLNHSDQMKTIKRRVRQLNMMKFSSVLKSSSFFLLLGTGVGLMGMRKYKLGSAFITGFLLKKLFDIGNSTEPDQKELELERYALKLERGDFGKIEVIPFR